MYRCIYGFLFLHRHLGIQCMGPKRLSPDASGKNTRISDSTVSIGDQNVCTLQHRDMKQKVYLMCRIPDGRPLAELIICAFNTLKHAETGRIKLERQMNKEYIILECEVKIISQR